MDLLASVSEKLAKTDDNEVVLDNNSGIYNYKYLLELIKVNCLLSEEEQTDINRLIDDFSARNTDIESILWYIDMFEDIVNQVLPEGYTIGFTENGDYLIYLVEEDY